MPKVYEQEGKGDEAVVHLHYFAGGQANWWITERDYFLSERTTDIGDEEDGAQHQAFGLANLFGGPTDQDAELGYISIAELLAAGAELDFHFKPRTLRELKAGKEPQPSAAEQAAAFIDSLPSGTITAANIIPLPLPIIDDPYQAGAIIESSWGYDQTNIDFFRIEKRTNDTLFLVPLHSRIVDRNGPALTGTSAPGDPMKEGEYVSCIGKWNGKPIRRRLRRRDDKPIGCSIKHGWASIWDGKPAHWTAYA